VSYRDQLLRVLEGQRRKQDAIDQREHRGVGADAQGERGYGDRCECRVSHQASHGVPYVIKKPRHLHRLSSFPKGVDYAGVDTDS